MHSASKLRVLHLDDDPFELERVQQALEQTTIDCNFAVESVSNVAAFRKSLAAISQEPAPDIVILDIHIDEETDTGINLADETRRLAPRAVILMCSTADDITTIADCLNAGADDFISKQSDKDELSLRVFNSYRLAKLKQGVSDPDSPRLPARGRAQPVGATVERISRRVPLIIDSAITAVFIRGESGTGKEVVADLFGASVGQGTAFVKVNCGAIAPTLLESELFGHVKGAFTGAVSDKRGLLEAASGGWIFLDEVATLSPSAQVALLRVLENQEVMRVGSTKSIPISVRVLSATNEPIEQLVREGRFRADLWQRLRETEITLPPLRERPEEIPALIRHFCQTMPGGPYSVSGPVMEVLSNVAWHAGNIRELRNCLRAMTEMHVNKLLTPIAIPERVWEEIGERPSTGNISAEPNSTPGEGASLGAATPPNAVHAAKTITLPFAVDNPLAYDHLADLLLLEMTRKIADAKGKLSLRSLAQTIGMSRSTLSGRLKAMVHKNIVELSDLSKIVGVSEK